jgi:hypothetical protein
MINADFGNDGGIYKIIWIVNNEQRTIPRLFGKDNNGVLYIGKTIKYLKRIIELKKSVLPNFRSDNHDFGKRYNTTSIISENIKLDELFVVLIKTNKPDEYEFLELEKYLNTYGELPPFNFKL